jgi:hypothetical protein
MKDGIHFSLGSESQGRGNLYFRTVSERERDEKEMEMKRETRREPSRLWRRTEIQR